MREAIRIYKSLLCVLLMLVTGSLWAQTKNLSPDKLENWELIGYAESAIRNGDTYSAIDFYHEYNLRKPQDEKVALILAKLFVEANDYQGAKEICLELYEKDNKKYLIQLYVYAEILKTEMDYENAASNLKLFRKGAKKHLSGTEKDLYLSLSAMKLKGCKLALQDTLRNDSLWSFHLGETINKAHLETAPLIFNDSTLIYASLQANNTPIVLNDEFYKAPKIKFYTASLKNGNWKGGYDAPKPFYNFDSLSTANGVFSQDKKRFYFTSSHKNRMNELISHIYVSHLDGWNLGKPKLLNKNINPRKYTATQPAIGGSYLPNYEIIYFVSDRPGGKGGMDIWFTVYDTQKKVYKKAVNAGGYINSPSDEVTPYYDNINGQLFYSSNGLPGFGGYDIYSAKGWGATWAQAINVGLPINSSYDDLYYVKSKNKDYGFVVSNRDGSVALQSKNCCYDIFEFSPIKKEDLFTNEPVIVELTDSDTTTVNMRDDEKKVSLKEELTQYVEEIIKQKQNGTTNEQIKPKSVNINSIYFDYDSAVLKEESKSLIDTTILPFLLKYYNIKVEIGAHTDNMGKENYNLKLSQKRANSVVDYLIFKGVSARKMEPIGYGEKKPIAEEFDSNGNDIPEGRRLNRRIEFKITGISIESN